MKLHKMNVFPRGANSVVALLSFAIAAATAQAETWYFNGDAYIDEGVDGERGFTTPGKWKDAEGSPATSFNSSDTYVVRNSSRLRCTSVDDGKSFDGGPIYFGDLAYSGTQAGNFRHEQANVTFPKGIHFVKGNYQVSIDNAALRDSRLYAVRIDVDSPASDPFQFVTRGGATYNNRRLLIDAPLYSGSEAGILIGDTSASGGGTNFTVILVGDCSNYRGQISVKPRRNLGAAFGNWDTCLMLADTTVGGTVKIFGGSAIEARKYRYIAAAYQSGDAAECTVGTLELAANSVIVVSGDATTPTNGIIHVRDSLSVTAPVAVNIKYDPRRTTTNNVTILTAPVSSNLDASDFVLRLDTFIPASHYSLAVKNDGVTKSLVAVFEPMVWQTAQYKGEKAKDSRDAVGSSLTNALAWSNSKLPGVDFQHCHYYSANDLRTLENISEDYDFPCATFTKGGGYLVVDQKSFRVPEFYTDNTCTIWLGRHNLAEKTIKANRFVLNGSTVSFGAWFAQTMIVDGEIAGSANLTFEGISGTSSTKGYYLLTGLNTNFTGNITVSQLQKNIAGETTVRWNFNTFFQTLYVEDGRNLGGAKAEFDSNALKITDMARLAVTNADVTLEAGLNRGLCIEGIGRLYVQEPGSLAVNWPVSVQGTMFKEGSGTLALGGGMTVIGGQSADATNRLFIVTNGYVKALSAGCVDGLTVSLAANAATGLKLDYTTADADLMQYGLKNVATDTPFEGGDINVSIENLTRDAFRSDRGKLGLITVKTTTAADYVATKLKVARVPNFDVKVEREADAETGWTTFSAKLTPCGFIMIFR